MILAAIIAIALGAAIGYYWRPAGPAGEPAAAGPAIADPATREATTSGGLYTAADIVANGAQSPFERYARQSVDPSLQHAQVAVGDYRCPITGAKGVLLWVVNGESYYFCCPPCIIEFVQWAKHEPAKVLPPVEYLVTSQNIDSLPPPTMGPGSEPD